MADDLIAFLHARLDEDEATAKGVRQPAEWRQGDESDPWARWDRDMIYMWPPEYHTPVESDKHWRGLQADDDNLAAHIARHDPARVLREVEAKRAILAEHITIGTEYPDLADSPDARACGGCGLNAREGYRTSDINGCPTLRPIAAIWSDHPDYRAEWAPSGEAVHAP